MKYFDEATVEKIRKGYYTAVYFNRTKQILLEEKNFRVATMQVFQKNEGSILCGIDEVVELLKAGTGYFEGEKWISKWGELKVEALSNGDTIGSFETVMHITGPYVCFAHLESLYLGILARQTWIATNTRKMVEAARGKPVIFFGDRFDYFLNQEADGYAAHIGGAAGVCTPAHAAWWGGSPSGTIPHALIALNTGDTVKSTKQFANYIAGGSGDIKVIALVDFHNDVIGTSLEVARAIGNKLWGVRIDTIEGLVDKSLECQMSQPKADPPLAENIKSEDRKYYGVNPELIRLVRKALDSNGFSKVKILVSGGFCEEKIKWFEEEKTPVDGYGVGSAIIHGGNDFTADIVKVEGKLIAKAGREHKDNEKMRIIR